MTGRFTNSFVFFSYGMKKSSLCSWKFKLLIKILNVFLSTNIILVVIFWDFLIFHQIFISPQVKRSVIISNKLGIQRRIQGVAWRAPSPPPPFFFFFAITCCRFFAITLKNYKLCSSLINACKSLIMHY